MKGLQLFLAAVFVVVLVGQWLFHSVEVPGPKTGGDVANGNAGTTLSNQPPEEPRSLPPLADYDEIGERPLFFEGRKVPDETVEADRPPELTKKQALNVGLTGIMFIDDVRYALVTDAAAKSTHRLKVGDEFQGWKVIEIAEDKIVMSDGGSQEEILLWEYKTVPLPGQATKREGKKSGVTRRAGERVTRTRPEPLKR